MRYILLLIGMMSDIIIFGVSAYVIFLQPWNPLIWLMVILTFKTWDKQGGFMAWQPKTIKSFLANAQNYGL